MPFFSFQNKVREQIGETDFFVNVYEWVLNRLETDKLNQKVIDEIGKRAFRNILGRDLPRTFTTDMVLEPDTQNQLKNNLEALAYTIPEVGYCQGMNFISATLLYILRDEELSFWLFYAMMKSLDMEHMYLPGVPELHLKNFQMSHLIRIKCPALFHHLKKIKMTTDYFTSKWIMTVFANSLPFEAIPTIFDNLLQDGWTSVYRIGIQLLRSIQPVLLNMDMFEITIYLRENLRRDTINIRKLLMEAERITINLEDIEHYKCTFSF